MLTQLCCHTLLTYRWQRHSVHSARSRAAPGSSALSQRDLKQAVHRSQPPRLYLGHACARHRVPRCASYAETDGQTLTLGAAQQLEASRPRCGVVVCSVLRCMHLYRVLRIYVKRNCCAARLVHFPDSPADIQRFLRSHCTAHAHGASSKIMQTGLRSFGHR